MHPIHACACPYNMQVYVCAYVCVIPCLPFSAPHPIHTLSHTQHRLSKRDTRPVRITNTRCARLTLNPKPYTQPVLIT
jgi:hypothetical protein